MIKSGYSAICLVLVLSTMTVRCAGAAESGAPHIILVMADDQGWGDTAYNGHPFVQTPALDAMAKRWVRL